MAIESIPLDGFDLRLAPGGAEAVRESLDRDTVGRYMAELDQLPPVVAYRESAGGAPVLADGFHRLEAHKLSEREAIRADVRTGGVGEAREHNLLANLRHGRPLSTAEKRRAIRRFLTWHDDRTDSWIAHDLGVDPSTVGRARAELLAEGAIEPRTEYRGIDGRIYVDDDVYDHGNAMRAGRDQLKAATRLAFLGGNGAGDGDLDWRELREAVDAEFPSETDKHIVAMAFDGEDARAVVRSMVKKHLDLIRERVRTVYGTIERLASERGLVGDDG